MATEITREDVLNFMSNHENGPLSPPSFRQSESAWIEWATYDSLEHFIKQNPEAVLDAVLDIALNPPDLSSNQYFSDSEDLRNDIEVEGGMLLAACSKIVPDLFLLKMTETLPLATRDVTRCILFWGIGDSNSPHAFELLKSLMPITSAYSEYELAGFTSALGGLGLHLKKMDETLILLRQIQNATSPERKEVHRELEFYLGEIEKAE